MDINIFETKIKPMILYIGTIVASIMAIAYIVCVFVLIEGFKVDSVLNTSMFSLATALIGFCIMQMLKIQGQSFAKNLPENQDILKEYYSTKTKDKKPRSMKYYWITSTIIDALTKVLTLAITSVGVVYIMIEGSGDYKLLLLAIVNILMFAGFGLVSLVKTYDYFNTSYIPYIKLQLENTRKEIKNVRNTEKQSDDSIEKSSRTSSEE